MTKVSNKKSLSRFSQYVKSTQPGGSVHLLADTQLLHLYGASGVEEVPDHITVELLSDGGINTEQVAAHFRLIPSTLTLCRGGLTVSPPLKPESTYTVFGEVLPQLVLDSAERMAQLRAALRGRAAKIGFAFDPRVLAHVPPNGRAPETPARVERTIAALRGHAILAEYVSVAEETENLECLSRHVIVPRLASPEEIYAVHNKEMYSDFIERGVPLPPSILTSDVYCNDATSVAARLSCGFAIDALNAVTCEDEALDGAFCLIRPPGHHCGHAHPNGFCVVNNIAVAVKALRKRRPKMRVAIVDIDVHHGEGVQELIESDEDVFYYSTHRYDGGKFFPYNSGAVTDVGKASKCLNIPFDTAAQDPTRYHEVISDEAYTVCAEIVLKPALSRFAPDVVVVACGFDAMYGDQLGRMAVTARGYKNVLLAIQDAISGSPGAPRGRIVVVLEGGYNAENVTAGCIGMLSTLLFGYVSEPIDFNPEVSAASCGVHLYKLSDEYWQRHNHTLSSQAHYYDCVVPQTFEAAQAKKGSYSDETLNTGAKSETCLENNSLVDVHHNCETGGKPSCSENNSEKLFSSMHTEYVWKTAKKSLDSHPIFNQ